MKSPYDKANLGIRLKALREEQHLSLRELGSRAQLAVSFLSKIESGKAAPTIMSLVKILEALRIEVADFFSSGREPADDIVFKKEGMQALQEVDRTWWYAFPNRRDLKVALTYEEYKPRSRVLEVEHHVCGYILDGTLTLEIPGRDAVKAEKGDAFYLKARQPHIARNDGARALRMVVVQLK